MRRGHGTEGQGQDELFQVLSGDHRPSSGELIVDGAPLMRRYGYRGEVAREAELVAQEAELLGEPREQVALLFRLAERQWIGAMPKQPPR